MELVTIRGASKRMSKPRSLTVEEFQRFVHHLGEPFHAIALVCVCFGYGDVVTDEMARAASKVAGLALNGM